MWILWKEFVGTINQDHRFFNGLVWSWIWINFSSERKKDIWLLGFNFFWVFTNERRWVIFFSNIHELVRVFLFLPQRSPRTRVTKVISKWRFIDIYVCVCACHHQNHTERKWCWCDKEAYKVNIITYCLLVCQNVSLWWSNPIYPYFLFHQSKTPLFSSYRSSPSFLPSGVIGDTSRKMIVDLTNSLIDDLILCKGNDQTPR